MKWLFLYFSDKTGSNKFINVVDTANGSNISSKKGIKEVEDGGL